MILRLNANRNSNLSCSELKRDLYLDISQPELPLTRGELLPVPLRCAHHQLGGGGVETFPGRHLQPREVTPHNLQPASH